MTHDHITLVGSPRTAFTNQRSFLLNEVTAHVHLCQKSSPALAPKTRIAHGAGFINRCAAADHSIHTVSLCKAEFAIPIQIPGARVDTALRCVVDEVSSLHRLIFA